MKKRMLDCDYFPKSPLVQVLAVYVAIIIVVTVLIVVFHLWCWLTDGESNSAAIRNLLISSAAFFGLPLAAWRSLISERQSETAERRLVNERYQQGAAMLGDKMVTVRLAGIYALRRLAEEGDTHHVQIMWTLCDFIRDPTKESSDRDASDLESNATNGPDTTNIRRDVVAALETLATRQPREIIEKNAGFKLDLSGANLAGLDFSASVLAGLNLSGAKLVKANLSNAKLAGIHLSGSDLSGAILSGSDLFGMILSGAKLSGTNFSTNENGRSNPAKGLEQSQLDSAASLELDGQERRPILDGVKDKAGRQLIWDDRKQDIELKFDTTVMMVDSRSQ
ncbi:MAG: pentapeptide repeat-containing protein [Gammaproteobacteria bacterium]|nr:pentapeptide repeat-containing protein [Gammaproteobacteria bacterium]